MELSRQRMLKSLQRDRYHTTCVTPSEVIPGELKSDKISGGLRPLTYLLCYSSRRRFSFS